MAGKAGQALDVLGQAWDLAGNKSMVYLDPC